MRFVKTAESIWNIPAGFQRVEYLQSSGGAYIDTGYVFQNLNHSTTITFKGLAAGSGGQPYHIFGSNKDNNRSGALSGISGNNNYIGIGIGGHGSGSSTERVATPTTPKTMTVVSKSTNKFDWIVDGTKVYSDVSFTGSSLSGISEYIFGINFTSDLTASTTVYHYQAEDNGVIVRDMIPCIDPLGVPCMYDLVGKKPYYNQGTGTFTVGRQVIPVEYLESSGTQRIDTGISTAEGICTEAKFKINQITSTSQVVFGKVGSTTTPTSRYWFGAQGSSLKWYYAVNEYITTSANSDADIHTVVLDTVNNVCTLDGETIATFSDLNSNSETISLFSVFYQGSLNNPMSGRIYYTKIWNNGTLVRDFIPCKDENNVGFMFDKVSGTCYLNAGTGAFIVGENKYTSKLRLIRDAIRIPDGYTRVEYLESSGTQYIDTGYPIVTSTDEIVVEYQNTSTQTHKWLFGSYESNANIGISSATITAPTFWYKGNINSTESAQYNSKHILKYDSTGMSNDGINLKAFTSYTGTWNLYLFALNNTGTSPNGYYGYGKIWGYKHKRNGVLIRSFIPVRDSNNVGYMFDEVTGQMFGNVGSGSFGLGNDLPTAKVRFIQDVLPREYRPLKYLEGTGTQYIDIGVIFNESVSYSWEIYAQAINSGNTDYNWFIGTQTPWAMAGIYPDNSQYTFYPVGTYYQNGQVVSNTSGEKYSLVKHVITQTGNSSNTLSLTLFARHNNNDGKSMSGTKRVFSCKISKAGNFIRDFYPALRKSDNKPGMYDRITKQFFTNQGTGEFNYEI